MEKEYVFLSLMVPEQLEKLVRMNSEKTMFDAANVFEHNLVEGLTQNLNTNMEIVNILPIGSFPQYYKKCFIKEQTFIMDGNRFVNLGFFNVKFFKNISIKKNVFLYLNKYCKKTKNDVVLFIYSASPEFLSAVTKLKKKNHNLIVCDIIADVPGMTNLSSKKSILLKWFLARQSKKSFENLQSSDCFVLLTKYMSDYLRITKPHIVIEGIASVYNKKTFTNTSTTKIIFYSGTLHKRFGILNLIEAFKLIPYSNYSLQICGVGDSVDFIKKEEIKDSRIKYLGQLSRDRVLNLQRKSTVLINPRQNNEEFTKYSFPSKTLEYLSSGVPVIAYKLDGIPDEYDAYINYVKDNSIESLKDKILEICQLPDLEREDMGKKGINFVLKTKNRINQTKKIVDMVNDIILKGE